MSNYLESVIRASQPQVINPGNSSAAILNAVDSIVSQKNEDPLQARINALKMQSEVLRNIDTMEDNVRLSKQILADIEYKKGVLQNQRDRLGLDKYIADLNNKYQNALLGIKEKDLELRKYGIDKNYEASKYRTDKNYEINKERNEIDKKKLFNSEKEKELKEQQNNIFSQILTDLTTQKNNAKPEDVAKETDSIIYEPVVIKKKIKAKDVKSSPLGDVDILISDDNGNVTIGSVDRDKFLSDTATDKTITIKKKRLIDKNIAKERYKNKMKEELRKYIDIYVKNTGSYPTPNQITVLSTAIQNKWKPRIDYAMSLYNMADKEQAARAKQTAHEKKLNEEIQIYRDKKNIDFNFFRQKEQYKQQFKE